MTYQLTSFVKNSNPTRSKLICGSSLNEDKHGGSVDCRKEMFKFKFKCLNCKKVSVKINTAAWLIVESKCLGFQKFRLTAMFLSAKIHFKLFVKTETAKSVCSFFAALDDSVL